MAERAAELPGDGRGVGDERADLQGRLPQELRLAGITTTEGAVHFVAAHNARCAVAAAEPGSAFVPFAGGLAEILCVQAERVVGNDNCVRYGGLSLQIPVQPHRHHFVKVAVRVHAYGDGRLAIFHGLADDLTVDRRSGTLVVDMALRRRPIYEDRDARLSILTRALP